jgi:hypothetical protein
VLPTTEQATNMVTSGWQANKVFDAVDTKDKADTEDKADTDASKKSCHTSCGSQSQTFNRKSNQLIRLEFTTQHQTLLEQNNALEATLALSRLSL